MNIKKFIVYIFISGGMKLKITGRNCILLPIIFGIIQSTHCSIPNRGKLLVKKEILNEMLFTEQDTIIKNSIYNVGNKKVENITFSDILSEHFSLVAGQLTINVRQMEPNEILTHLIVVKPTNSGKLAMNEAQVRYSSDNTKILSYSTKIEGIIVQSAPLYYKRFSYNRVKWFKVLAAMAAAVLIPFLLWKSTERKFKKYNFK